MYIIVGLGNPGKRYEHTRHNIGFITLDILAKKYGIRIDRIKHKALVGEGSISGQKVVLVKPQTFMNLSGNSVREAVSFFRLPLENLIVVYDDIDIPAGSLRIRKRGSAGTHNGMRSVIYDLQQDGFPRVRVGIGGERRARLTDYVTGRFRKEERILMEDSVLRTVEALECILLYGIDRAMNEYNVKKAEKGQEAAKDREKG